MTVDAVRSRGRAGGMSLAQTVHLAWRDLRGGISGFTIFVACVALGVAVISGVGALTEALENGFRAQGQVLLGGDVTLTRSHQPARADELRWLRDQGRVSTSAAFRGMARLADGSNQVMVEIKAVDGQYPFYGNVEVEGGNNFRQLIDAPMSAVVDPILIERLGLKLGDKVKIGVAQIILAGVIKREPDRLGGRFIFGPRVLISHQTFQATGLNKPGSLIRWTYQLKLNADGGQDQVVADFSDHLDEVLPESGFTVRDRRNPTPAIKRAIDRFSQFLTLVGLTALLVGGVGIANAVSTFVEKKRKTIATFKSLGAPSRFIFLVFLLEVLMVTGLGVLIGLALGSLLPVLLNAVFGGQLLVLMDLGVSLKSMVIALAYGFLVALVFILWPLGRARNVNATVLFRDEVGADKTWPGWDIVIATLLSIILLAGFAIATAQSVRIAIYFVVGVAVLFAVFFALGAFAVWLAGSVPRPKKPELKLALANLAGPGALTRSVVVSLGSGLTLLVAVALVDHSIVRDLRASVPQKAPSYYVLDIDRNDIDAIRQIVEETAPGSGFSEAPMLRGRITKIGGKSPDELKIPPRSKWVLNGDRGLSYSETVPRGSKVIEGEWWGKDYSGEPLVSFEAEIARDFGLKVGDRVTVNVLGRDITARIANLRELEWESLAINFVLTFSPNVLRAAPHSLLATIKLADPDDTKLEARLIQKLVSEFPGVTAIRVKDAIDAFAKVFTKVMTGIRAAGLITLFAGALVLAGALATAQRRRIYQSVVLKTLGATRWRVISVHMWEYLLLASITALLAVLLGTLGAYVVVTKIIDVEFVFALSAVLGALALSSFLVILFGAIGTWRVLNVRAMPYLRSE